MVTAISPFLRSCSPPDGSGERRKQIVVWVFWGRAGVLVYGFVFLKLLRSVVGKPIVTLGWTPRKGNRVIGPGTDCRQLFRFSRINMHECLLDTALFVALPWVISWNGFWKSMKCLCTALQTGIPGQALAQLQHRAVHPESVLLARIWAAVP